MENSFPARILGFLKYCLHHPCYNFVGVAKVTFLVFSQILFNLGKYNFKGLLRVT
jgi:hypothetical protein